MQSSGRSRGRAVILFLVRLGLRASEVANLEFDHIDWRNGRIAIRGGKSRREEWLSLPQEVGEALRDLARWLYRQLQSEYDHLTSDEAVEDGIIANEYTFTAGGRRFG